MNKCAIVVLLVAIATAQVRAAYTDPDPGDSTATPSELIVNGFVFNVAPTGPTSTGCSIYIPAVNFGFEETNASTLPENCENAVALALAKYPQLAGTGVPPNMTTAAIDCSGFENKSNRKWCTVANFFVEVYNFIMKHYPPKKCGTERVLNRPVDWCIEGHIYSWHWTYDAVLTDTETKISASSRHRKSRGGAVETAAAILAELLADAGVLARA